MKDIGQCPTCKYFVLCSLDKMAFHQITGTRCDEYKEKEKKEI